MASVAGRSAATSSSTSLHPPHHTPHHGHGHGIRHPRPRQRSTSRSSSSPSPPPPRDRDRDKRRSFSSRTSPSGTARRSIVRYDNSPLINMAIPPETPNADDGEGGMWYGASTSSIGGRSGSESEGLNRYLSQRGRDGEDTEVEKMTKRRRSSEEVEKIFQKGSTGNDTGIPERISPPPSARSLGKKANFHPVSPVYTILPIVLGWRDAGGKQGEADGIGGRAGGIRITRKICEDAIVLGGVVCGIWKLGWTWEERALAGEIGLLVGLSIIYITFRFRPLPKQPPLTSNRSSLPATVSFHLPDRSNNFIRERASRSSMSHSTPPPAAVAAIMLRERSGSEESVNKTGIGDRGCVWGTDEREYRECLDDGVLFALLLGPLIASAMLHAALTQLSSNPAKALNRGWIIENPLVLPSTPIRQLRGVISLDASDAVKALSALATSRRNLVQLFTLCSFVLLVQLAWSLRLEIKLSKGVSQGISNMEREISDTQRIPLAGTYWLRKGELRRNLSVVGMAFLVTGGCIIVKIATAYIGHGVWSDMSPSDIIIATLFYQFSIYVCIRLARRGFTLGELAVVCNAATALFMETVNMTRMKIRILRTPYIKTYRLPTPLLTFQLALIPGSLLAGLILSPLLYLSRHLAQKPAHRLRFPHEKPIHRRLLALGFYAGSLIVCGGLVGTWARWCLNWRDPVLWVVYYLFEGKYKWSRPALLSYWALLAMVSVAGWSRQLSRARRHRRYVVPGSKDARDGNPPVTALGSGERISGVATQMMDAADSRMPTLSVNARRKSFHALAVIMFVPGIAVDPAFTHLSFSVAFAAFNFAEYIRYFALWPFGVSVHLFLNEFLDHKDSGTAILSHFYLLAGCAAPLWLEGPCEILSYFGILALGIGDALASIVGRRIGKLRWAPTSGKTVEGSIAFFLSVMLASIGLWAFGIVDDFKITGYMVMTALSTLLEAFSAQNDNLILPMYGWALGTLLGM